MILGGLIITALALVLGGERSSDGRDQLDAVEAAPTTSPTSTTVSPPPPAMSPTETTAPTATSSTPGAPEPADAAAVAATGTFAAAPGGTPQSGQGPLRTYAVEVEDGIPIEPAVFAAEVDRVLTDPRSWTGDGSLSLRRVDPADQGSPAADFVVVLATPATTDRLCAPLQTNGIFSCYQRGKAVVNLMRWTEGAGASDLDLPRYREYVINHEVGHALGYGHVGCPGAGIPAPVMMQQTKGIGACAPNPWPFP